MADESRPQPPLVAVGIDLDAACDVERHYGTLFGRIGRPWRQTGGVRLSRLRKSGPHFLHPGSQRLFPGRQRIAETTACGRQPVEHKRHLDAVRRKSGLRRCVIEPINPARRAARRLVAARPNTAFLLRLYALSVGFKRYFNLRRSSAGTTGMDGKKKGNSFIVKELPQTHPDSGRRNRTALQPFSLRETARAAPTAASMSASRCGHKHRFKPQRRQNTPDCLLPQDQSSSSPNRTIHSPPRPSVLM